MVIFPTSGRGILRAAAIRPEPWAPKISLVPLGEAWDMRRSGFLGFAIDATASSFNVREIAKRRLLHR